MPTQNKLRPSQRTLAFAALLVCLSALSCATAAREPTGQTHSGPWYQPGAPATTSLWQAGEPGTPLYLHGLVLDARGAPLADALVELWHTDAGGNYPPLRASLRTGANGSFRIRTVLPGHNGGYRARHIHFVITHPAHRRLVTRIYFKGDPNMDEAPYPELAVLLEESKVDNKLRLYASPQFILAPR